VWCPFIFVFIKLAKLDFSFWESCGNNHEYTNENLGNCLFFFIKEIRKFGRLLHNPFQKFGDVNFKKHLALWITRTDYKINLYLQPGCRIAVQNGYMMPESTNKKSKKNVHVFWVLSLDVTVTEVTRNKLVLSSTCYRLRSPLYASSHSHEFGA
jgi:hypothetical protein